jgi:hypothetical protein
MGTKPLTLKLLNTYRRSSRPRCGDCCFDRARHLASEAECAAVADFKAN